MQPFSANCLMALYICTKFQENISKGFRITKQSHTKIYLGVKFHKNVGGVTILILCISPDNALYLSQVL